MKVPFSWLKEYVDIDVTAQELEDKLFGCGFEVEELIDLSAEIGPCRCWCCKRMYPGGGNTSLHM